MKRKRNPFAHANRERWLVSYADFITLLFAFFVVLYASSQVDKTRMSDLSAAIEGAFHQLGAFQSSDSGSSSAMPPAKTAMTSVTRPDAFPDLRHELEHVLAAEIAHREIALWKGPEGLVISLREIGFFDSGSATLRPGSEAPVARIASLLRERDVFIRIEGHTDNVPIHNSRFTSNWELSTARATQMIKIFISNYGFAPNRLSAAGYGEFHPLATNATVDGRRQNRRLDLVIVSRPLPHSNESQLVWEQRQHGIKVNR